MDHERFLKAGKGQIMQGFANQSKKFGFYTKHKGKPPEVFKHVLVNVLIEVSGG